MPTESATQQSARTGPDQGSTFDAGSRAHDAADRMQEQAHSVAGQAQDRIREQMDQRSAQLGTQFQQHASDLRSVSTALREQGEHGPARITARVSGYAEQASTYLQSRDSGTILADVEDLGRQRPGAVAAGALALGFMASRLLKASSGRRYQSRGESPAPMGQTAHDGTATPHDGTATEESPRSELESGTRARLITGRRPDPGVPPRTTPDPASSEPATPIPPGSSGPPTSSSVR